MSDGSLVRGRPRFTVLGGRQRVVAVVVAVAVGAAGLGWWFGRSIESPDDVARRAAAPAAAPILVPVERRTLESTVVSRGDVSFAQAVEVAIDSDLGDGSLGSLVVTGRVPASGAQVDEGDVLLEASGRPVILLQGALPMYRALGPGSRGNDVRQLEAALRRLRVFAGTVDTVYDGQTAAAVSRLYTDLGYEAVAPSAEDRAGVAEAQAALRAAETAVSAATVALAEAARPPARSEVLAAEGAVENARSDRDAARAALDAAAGGDDATLAQLRAALVAADNALAVASAQLAELRAPRDTTAAAQALAQARAEAASARTTLAEARGAAGIRLPRGEIAFVPSLPRRVDKVNVKVGAVAAGPAVSLSGADLQVVSGLSREESRLLRVGAAARLDDEVSGVDLTGTVTAVAESPGTEGVDAGRYAVRITPEGGDPAALAGANLRVTIPIESTAGAVLAVPLAALVTDASGTARVRVSADDATRDVVVTVGLAADGFAEVTAPDLAEGDLVVVGER
ncbi:peptidoglycan-binding protein [Asanoa siamensis]|uniref:peptidoglycan-binding protein n=1 Tax=Asanoa siamensis TaxID=926357 RepID=UPI001EF233A2|nr:peptidoglycan-binding protein [Asanoa siamensis]